MFFIILLAPVIGHLEHGLHEPSIAFDLLEVD